MLAGNANVEAYLDNEKGTPKISPGQCRILREVLPTSPILIYPFLKRSKISW